MANFKKSSNFDRNLDFKTIDKQIQKNLFKGSEILKQSSNKIAPIDTGQLRSNINDQKKTNKIIVSWDQPYAGKVYVKNKKNPQATKWIEKGMKQKKSVLDKIMNDEVMK